MPKKDRRPVSTIELRFPSVDLAIGRASDFNVKIPMRGYVGGCDNNDARSGVILLPFDSIVGSLI
jgi:hypothetical protein